MATPQGIYSIDDYHRALLFLENKQTSGFHSPSQIDDAINWTSYDLFGEAAPLDGTTEEARSALDPFRQIFQVTPNNSPGGLVSLPSGLGPQSPLNFARLSGAMTVTYNNAINPATGFPFGTQYYDIEFVNEEELPRRLMSQIKPISIARPIAQTVANGVIQLYPQVPNTAIFRYVGLPVAAQAVYTQVGRVLTYSQSASTQLQWNDSFFRKIIAGACVYLGINMDDTLLTEFMNKKLAS